MTSVSISMVRNEQDIIEPFLRHHAALVDVMVVLDNRSSDATRQIMVSVARALGNIVIADVPDAGYNQSEIMTRALQHVQGAALAEYVFFLDGDEFLPFVDRAALSRHLAGVPKGGVGLMPWSTFLPDPDLPEEVEPEPLRRMTFRRKVEAPLYYKAVYRAHGGLDAGVTVEQGNHHLRDAFCKALPSVVLADVPLRHFPLRSTEQLAAKGVVGWLANQERAAGPSQDTAAYQWKRLHDLVQDGKRPDRAELAAEALRYAQTGTPGNFAEGALRADHGIRPDRSFSDGRFAAADRLIAEAQAGAGGALGAPFVLPPPPAGQDAGAQISNAFHGAWHWDFLFLDVPPIRFAIDRFAPRSVLDLGCGNGLYPLLYQHLGVPDVLGVDGIEPEATVLTPGTYCKTDLQQPFDAGRKFDLVICLEVVEHLFPAATDTMFDTIARHAADTILFSMAEPGQPGNGHINCLSMSDVLDHWARRGWQPDLAMTLGMRALSSMSWFRRNIVILHHTGETGETPAAAALRQIGRLPYVWYNQAAGQRETAFDEPFPDIKHGYGLRHA